VSDSIANNVRGTNQIIERENADVDAGNVILSRGVTLVSGTCFF
jgi:hypothetical protein